VTLSKANIRPGRSSLEAFETISCSTPSPFTASVLSASTAESSLVIKDALLSPVRGRSTLKRSARGRNCNRKVSVRQRGRRWE
jgi:hypothetical protein